MIGQEGEDNVQTANIGKNNHHKRQVFGTKFNLCHAPACSRFGSGGRRTRMVGPRRKNGDPIS
jgi:hypothetical protein